MTNEAKHIQPVGSKRGAYSKLNPQFAEIVDYFCSSEEATRLSDSSIRCSASRATQFLYYLQKKELLSLDDVKEDDVVSFLSRMESLYMRQVTVIVSLNSLHPCQENTQRLVLLVHGFRMSGLQERTYSILQMKKLCSSRIHALLLSRI